MLKASLLRIILRRDVPSMEKINKLKQLQHKEYLNVTSFASLGIKTPAMPKKQEKKQEQEKILTCKLCGSESIEMLWYKRYGRHRKCPWNKTKKPSNYFTIHCLKCKNEYEQHQDSPKLAIKNAANKIPFVNYSFKKKYIIPLVKNLKQLRNTKTTVVNRKQYSKHLQKSIGKYLEPGCPMKINNWIITNNRKGIIKIFDSVAYDRLWR